MTVKKISDTMTPSLKKISVAFADIPETAYEYFRKITPKRTGNARRNTRLKDSTIEANYNYAVPLDQGSSKQAPQGMSEPTQKYIKKLADQAIKK